MEKIYDIIFFIRNSAIRENLISIFRQLSASIREILSLEGRLGTRL